MQFPFYYRTFHAVGLPHVNTKIYVPNFYHLYLIFFLVFPSSIFIHFLALNVSIASYLANLYFLQLVSKFLLKYNWPSRALMPLP